MSVKPQTETQKLEGGEYRASDLLKLAGLTYRQLHDWEERAGVMESERVAAEGWRKFTRGEVMALAVCASLRRQLLLPLEGAAKIYQWLIGKRHNELDKETVNLAKLEMEKLQVEQKVEDLLKLEKEALRAAINDPAKRGILRRYFIAKIRLQSKAPIVEAVELARMGSPVYLLSDLSDDTAILAEHQLADWLAKRLLSKPSIVCWLNNIINEVLEKSGKTPMALDTISPSLARVWQMLLERPDLTAAERKVIDLIRERAYQRVTAHVKGGEVIRVDMEEELSEGDQAKLEEKILAAINSGDHLSVTVEKRDGKVVRIGRKISFKLDK